MSRLARIQPAPFVDSMVLLATGDDDPEQEERQRVARAAYEEATKLLPHHYGTWLLIGALGGPIGITAEEFSRIASESGAEIPPRKVAKAVSFLREAFVSWFAWFQKHADRQRTLRDADLFLRAFNGASSRGRHAWPAPTLGRPVRREVRHAA